MDAALALEHYVVPVTIAILVLVFLFQRRGTAGVALVFGPVILLWFLTLAVLGNAQVPTRFFRLPPNRVIEIGMQVEI